MSPSLRECRVVPPNCSGGENRSGFRRGPKSAGPAGPRGRAARQSRKLKRHGRRIPPRRICLRRLATITSVADAAMAAAVATITLDRAKARPFRPPRRSLFQSPHRSARRAPPPGLYEPSCRRVPPPDPYEPSRRLVPPPVPYELSCRRQSALTRARTAFSDLRRYHGPSG